MKRFKHIPVFPLSSRPALLILLIGAFLTTEVLIAQVAPQEGVPSKNIVEREAARRARESGFGDLDVDNLHGSLARRMNTLLSYGRFTQRKGSDRALMMGTDRDGKTYFRFRLREGSSFSVETHPTSYIFRAHCFLYLSGPDKDGKRELEKIVFQFYRINFSGVNYVRELRRITHPNPKNLVGDDPLRDDIKLLNNDKLLLELYEDLSTVKPFWEGIDGIPVPTLRSTENPDLPKDPNYKEQTWAPKERIELNNPRDLIPYEKQVRIMIRYKRLLRRIDQDIYTLNRSLNLGRKIRIEKIMDFPG